MEDVKLGFTGHRHDDELGLVDMKGRIYDPAQKRFLTPDPFVPSPLFGQSYNRYSYVLNNPLRYTDPTGYQVAQAGLVSPEPSTSPEGLNVPEGKTEIIEVWAISEPRKPQQSDENGFEVFGDEPGSDATVIVEPPVLPEVTVSKDWSYARHFLWGAAKQVFSSLPPVAAVRQIGHNLQIAGTAITQAMNGDLSLAGNTVMELPQQMAEGAAGFLLGVVEAGLSLPATINTVINSPDPEARGAAAVKAVQQTATVALTIAGATSKTPGPNKRSTLQPGPHAGKSIPARGPERNFSPAERQAVNDIGYQTGCHTCGTKNPGTPKGNFVLDHQPPNGLAGGQPQRLFPQCSSCSRLQGGQVNGELRRKE